MRFNLTHFTALILLGTSIVASPAALQAKEPQPKISITGVGTAKRAPDLAVISLGVLREAKTAREALTENNAAMSDLIAAMRALGVEEKDMQTSNFSIQPRYFYPERKANGEHEAPRIIGYSVSNNLEVRIKEIEKTGEALDQAVTLGANTGGNIRFTNQDVEALLDEARINAVQNAMKKAEILVVTAGAKLGEIVSISETSNNPRPQKFAQARALSVQEDAGQVPIASGENSYRVTVNITWKIDQ